MVSKVERVCACGCGRTFMARVADVKRGWGKFFSKSCKAIEQERRTGQYASLTVQSIMDDHEGQEWDAHKNIF